MTRRHVLAAGWLLVLALSALLPVSALLHGILHLGTSPIVERSTLTRPLISIGSDVTLARGSTSVVVSLFGDVHVEGTVHNDVVAAGGRIYLERGSRVTGDVLGVAGGIYLAPDAVVAGRLGGALHRWNGKPVVPRHNLTALLTGSMRLGLAAGLALLLAGACLTVVFPWQVVLISSTLKGSPLKSGLAGLASLATFLFLVVPLGLSLAGLPFALLLTAAATLAWLFGMTAAAVVVGRLVARGPVSLLWASAAGLVALAVVMAIPVVGPMTVIGTGLLGAGALAVALVNRARPAAPLP
ncbi:MAG TPA: polymer-forming cytoskeletal protein [Chloroflexota bacterium]|nr:polymer-forming cytoskeletal protein [Chloroflexota bacterium]